MNLINCKVFWNKSNGQGRVHIPKKAFQVPPSQISIQIPNRVANKQFLFRNKNYKGGNTLRK